MEAVQRASGFLFYALGSVLIVLLLLAKRGIVSGLSPYLHSIDLPLLLVAMLYGGSSLYVSLSKGKQSLPLLLVIVVPMGVLFAVFWWFNFAVPYPEF